MNYSISGKAHPLAFLFIFFLFAIIQPPSAVLNFVVAFFELLYSAKATRASNTLWGVRKGSDFIASTFVHRVERGNSREKKRISC